ncbi:hypothetical protein [Puia dinghuensis]|uniref:hypothetical protein n=1 Tax=Puia dinghuensis TaxID=1792502 RepID=UPI00166CBB44|nr:hypothetical protein [Puia dinghuensis]
MADKSNKQRDEIITFSFLGLKLSCHNPGSKAIVIIACVLTFLIAMTILLMKN